MQDERLYQVALTMIPDLGAVRAKALVEKFGTARSVFQAKRKEIAATEGIGEVCARSLKEWQDFTAAEEEIRFAEKHGVELIFLTEEKYPQRLFHCYDPPVLLYYKGNADLNQSRIVSIIGTRNHTEYGRQVTEELVQALSKEQVMVVSGLAFGIDTIAHKTALQKGIPTIGVLGHGMDTIYPWQNRHLAKEMIEQGGLLTEFSSGTKPDKHNFPRRNRIVAGMADATIVIETANKGGSMITAELAYSYNRDLFAVPGRTTDQKSGGCLQLIRQQKATVLLNAVQLLDTMGWQEKKKTIKKQRELFPELNENEQKIVTLLQQHEVLPIDTLYLLSGLSSSVIASAILNLEMQHVITSMPGKLYKLQ